MGGLPHVLAVGLLAAGLSGCTLLDLLLGSTPPGPGASFPPQPEPSAVATYSTGRVTIELDGETLVLDRVLPGAAMEAEYGTHVVWTNGAGWYVSYSRYDDLGVPIETTYLSIDRIVNNEHWVIADPFRCVATTTHADATGITGTAICRGLNWSDWFSSYQGTGLPQQIPGQSAFDADIMFEAR